MDQSIVHAHSNSTDVTVTASRDSMDKIHEKEGAPNPHNILGPKDPDNPQNWPIYRKVYVSAVALAFACTVAFGLTSYTAGITGVMKRYDVDMTKAISAFSLYLFGIAFAPIYTPHLSERFGRVPVYLASLPIFMLFTLGVGFSKNFASLSACRFFAGFFGGPSLVLIEGTFADVWHSKITGIYYSSLSLASYLGAAFGPLIGGYVFAAGGWKWTQWVTLMIAVGTYLFGIGMPETYAREIVRARARRAGRAHNLPKALSGVTFGEMFASTVVIPLKQLTTEPIVILSLLYTGFTFGVLFQFFISVPVVLTLTYKFTIQHDGLAFLSAIVGSLLSFLTTSIIDRIAYPHYRRKHSSQNPPIEYRMIAGVIASVTLPASLFWIGWSAKPTVHWAVPVVGTGVYVWSSMSSLISFISYLFDAYPPQGTLAALTIVASFRLLMAGAFPLFIIQMITNLTGPWAFSTFAFIAIGLAPAPWIVYFFGQRLRIASRYNKDEMMMMPVEDQTPNGDTSMVDGIA